jgi:hypothetical protein
MAAPSNMTLSLTKELSKKTIYTLMFGLSERFPEQTL